MPHYVFDGVADLVKAKYPGRGIRYTIEVRIQETENNIFIVEKTCRSRSAVNVKSRDSLEPRHVAHRDTPARGVDAPRNAPVVRVAQVLRVDEDRVRPEAQPAAHARRT